MKRILFAIFAVMLSANAWAACSSGYVQTDNGCMYGKFVAKTTNVSSGATFDFYLNPTGTFTVNCGTGGTLSRVSGSNTTVSGTTISRTGTAEGKYRCTYSSSGVKYITFNSSNVTYNGGQTIKFQNNTNLAAVYGDISALFPTSASTTSTNTMFYGTFGNCTGLTSIPSTLFASLNMTNVTNTNNMFYFTFYGCTSLTSIPSDLFSTINTSKSTNTRNMFNGTFTNCASLTSIPSGLFSTIRTPNSMNTGSMFQSTFNGCTNLTSIPSGLFSTIVTTNVTSASNIANMFAQIFDGCESLSGFIPSDAFPVSSNNPYLTSTANAWTNAFASTHLATSCPSNLSQYTTGYESQWTESNAGRAVVACACNPGYTLSGSSCNANTINITWSGADASAITANNAAQCTYGGAINTPSTAPHIPGKVFVGWRTPALYDFTTLDYTITGSSYDSNNTAMTWNVLFSYGTVYGDALCSLTRGASAVTGDPSSTSGSYCWCRATGYKPMNSDTIFSPFPVTSWVYVNNLLGCLSSCAGSCARYSSGTSNVGTDFTKALFGQ